MNKYIPATDVEARHEENCFDFLRLFAAVLVFISHSYPLVGETEPIFLNMTLGEFGVNIFFTTSGYLITQSWLRNPSPKIYLAKRFMRIFPALFVVISVTVFIVGPIVTSITLVDYFSNMQTYRYLMNFFFLGGGQLPGVFANNPFANSVNGSLWTLKYEFAMYFCVLVFGLVSKSNLLCFNFLIRIALALSLIISLCLSNSSGEGLSACQFKDTLTAVGVSDLMLRFPLLATFFLFGATFANRKLGLQADWVGIGILSLMLFLPLDYAVSSFLVWLITAYASLNIGVGAFLVLKRVGKYGDFSYGIYIYAFLVQQIVSYYLMPNINWMLAFVLSGLITAILAWVSWVCIESPVLKLKSKL
jgi:peptidoglycan/LPS O-acetylase OafA/YrhL